MAPVSLLRLVVGMLLAVPALSASVKSLLLGYPHRRIDQTEGLVSFNCTTPNTFITSIALYAGAYVDYVDYIICTDTEESVTVNAGKPPSTSSSVVSSDGLLFTEQAHGTNSNGFVTKLSLIRSDGALVSKGSDPIVTDAPGDVAPAGTFAMGIWVSADSTGLLDFQFIYATTTAPTPSPTLEQTTPAPVLSTNSVAARDLTITFNITDTTAASLDEAALLTASASLTGVSEANVGISFSDVASTGARRLDTTTMVTVIEYVAESTVATDEITADALGALTGLDITDWFVEELPPASNVSTSINAGLLAGVIVSAIALCGILAYAFYRCKIRKDAVKALAPKLDVENVLGENVPPIHEAEISHEKAAPVHAGPALAPFGASDFEKSPPVARPVAVREREKLPPTYRAPSII